jgi:calcineurin-like phosphoesterase family protein
MSIWFTSDTHFGHTNIAGSKISRWSSGYRDFNSVHEMNMALVDGINKYVKEDDILYHLGDWSFGGAQNILQFRKYIVCKNIHLILGNHDHHIMNNRENVQRLFSSVSQYMHLDLRVPKKKNEIERYTFVCFHYPIASWNGMNDKVFHLHGHCHLPPQHRIAQGRAMDVGVDGNSLEPISFREVISLLKERPIAKLALPKDHHEKRVL